MNLKLHVHNHRARVDQSDVGPGWSHKGGNKESVKGQEPFFRAWLWKLRHDGDPLVESHWFQRDTWLSKNGSLIYGSEREGRELIYHTKIEVVRVSVRKMSNKESCKEWAIKL